MSNHVNANSGVDVAAEIELLTCSRWSVVSKSHRACAPWCARGAKHYCAGGLYWRDRWPVSYRNVRCICLPRRFSGCFAGRAAARTGARALVSPFAKFQICLSEWKRPARPRAYACGQADLEAKLSV